MAAINKRNNIPNDLSKNELLNPCKNLQKLNRRIFLQHSTGLLALSAGLALNPTLLFAQNTKKGANMQTNAILQEFFTLNDGVKIPRLGLGVWRIEDNKVENVIKEALKVGYRHIDTAQAYNNERGVGAAVKTALKEGIKRQELFITSKIRAEYKDAKSAANSINTSLKTMGLDYIDLMLIHSPQPWSDFRGGDYFKENVAVWNELIKAQKAGKVKSIGVSNFLQKDLENLFHNSDIKPSVNQVLAHIGNTPFSLIDFCRAQNIYVEAYSPIGHGKLLKNPKIVAMAQKYKVSPAQLCIRYTLELGLIPLPKSKTPKYIAENAELNFSIAKADLEELKAMSFDKEMYEEVQNFPVFSGK